MEWHKKPIEVEATLIRFHSSFYSEYVQGIGAPLVSITLTEVVETFPVQDTAAKEIVAIWPLHEIALVLDNSNFDFIRSDCVGLPEDG